MAVAKVKMHLFLYFVQHLDIGLLATKNLKINLVSSELKKLSFSTPFSFLEMLLWKVSLSVR